LALTAFAYGIISVTPWYRSYAVKLPKSGSVPQRGWLTSFMTPASHAPFDESPP